MSESEVLRTVLESPKNHVRVGVASSLCGKNFMQSLLDHELVWSGRILQRPGHVHFHLPPPQFYKVNHVNRVPPDRQTTPHCRCRVRCSYTHLNILLSHRLFSGRISATRWYCVFPVPSSHSESLKNAAKKK